MARGTVLKYLRASSFPERASSPRPRLIDPYVPYVQERWNHGEHNARVRWKAIRAQGFAASDVHVRRLVNGWRAPTAARGAAGTPQIAKPDVISFSVRKTRWLLLKAAGTLSVTESASVTALTRLSPHLADAQRLVNTFHLLLREHALDRFPSWLEECAQCGIPELAGFAQSLRRDSVAVEAAVCSPWSQGQTEGQVNRLKTLKRQMYGRAGFALLRRRVLSQPARAM
jgi:transposase